MKKIVLFTVLASICCLQGEGSASSLERGVPTQAYLYVNDPQNDVTPVDYVEVTLFQSDRIRHLGCRINESQWPTSPEAMKDLVESENCFRVSGSEHQELVDQDSVQRIIHQRGSDRYVMTGVLIASRSPQPDQPKPYIQTGMYTVTFDARNPETMHHVMTYMNYTDGENPKITTRRARTLKAFEATIEYPQIQETPITQ